MKRFFLLPRPRPGLVSFFRYFSVFKKNYPFTHAHTPRENDYRKWMCDRPLTEEKTTLYPQQINNDIKANSSVYYTNHQSLTLSSLFSCVCHRRFYLSDQTFFSPSHHLIFFFIPSNTDLSLSLLFLTLFSLSPSSSSDAVVLLWARASLCKRVLWLRHCN